MSYRTAPQKLGKNFWGAVLFIIPYMHTTHAHFYEDLKKEQEEYESALAEA